MSDDEKPEGQEPETDEAELEASEVVTDEKGNKTVSLSTMLRYKKEARDNAKRIKELEPIAAKQQETATRLDQASPIINAILANPKLKAEALRIANGTRTSADTTEQPEDDADASAYAEDMGFYLPDGMTLDVARAQRVLARLDQRHGRQTDERIRPLAGVTLGQKAEQHLRAAMAETDNDGTPLATPESIQEVANQLPRELLANPAVIELVLNSAIGIDKRKGRSPKAQDEPLYFETGGSRGRRNAPTVDPELAAAAKRLGIDEKDLAASNKRLEEGVMNRRGIALGGSR